MYQKIFQSYVRFEQSRGLSFKIAKSRGVSAFTLFALLNVVAVTFLIQLLWGPGIADWVAEHAWAVAIVTIALLAFHSTLGKTISQSPEPVAKPVPNGSPATGNKYLWAWYVAATLVLWVFACIAVIVRLSPPH